MDYMINENLTFAVPNIAPILREADSSAKKSGGKRLIVEIAAIHEGVSKNYNKYTAEELEKATSSWLTPFPKPLILNHNIESEPLGRMINASFERNVEKVGYIQLRASVADPDAAAKVLDGRYLTGSVGGMPTAAICSICNSDVVAGAKEGKRCGHERGQIYDGQICSYEHRGISFHEYSFVNAPGDSNSLIQAHITESDFSVYSVDFEKAEVAKFQESEGFIDIREMISESEAYKTYIDLAFGTKYAQEMASSQEFNKNITFEQNISTIGKESDDSDLEHNQMTDKNKQEEVKEESATDEDILDVADRLTTDLSQESNDSEENADLTQENDEATAEDTKVEETEGDEAKADEDVASQEADEDSSEEETVEESTEDKVEDKIEDTEAEEATTQEAEADEGEAAAEAEESEKQAADETAEVEEADTEDAKVKESDETEAAPEVAELQARIETLEAENQELKDQNKRMKQALHAELAEKVVDARIAVGHIDISEREAAIEEHKARTPSSLADALVDVRNFAEKNNFQVEVVEGRVPSLDIKAVISESSNENTEVLDENSGEIIEKDVVKPDDLFVEEFTAMLTNGVEKYHKQRSRN